MTKLNLILWAVSLALQCLLLAALFSRAIARRIPILAVLIGFYILRSAASYTVFRYLQPASSEFLFSWLAVIDVVLQTVTAWVLFSAAERFAGLGTVERGGSWASLAGASTLRLFAVFSVLLMVAAGVAVVGSMFIRANPRAPVDRTILFISTVYLLVFLATVRDKAPALIRRLVAGFAFYAGASIVCQIGRAVAGAHRDVTAFQLWSYAEPAAYLVLVLFWIVALPSMSRYRRIRCSRVRLGLGYDVVAMQVLRLRCASLRMTNFRFDSTSWCARFGF